MGNMHEMEITRHVFCGIMVMWEKHLHFASFYPLNHEFVFMFCNFKSSSRSSQFPSAIHFSSRGEWEFIKVFHLFQNPYFFSFS